MLLVCLWLQGASKSTQHLSLITPEIIQPNSSQFPSVHSVPWRPILSFLFFSFSVKLLAVLLILFCYIIDQSNSSYFLFKIYFLTTPLGMGVSIVWSKKKKRKRNQPPQIVFSKVTFSKSWHWIVVANIVFYFSFLPLFLVCNSCPKNEWGEGGTQYFWCNMPE